MTKEPSRISIVDETDAASGQTSARFGPATEVRRQVNYHNIWFGSTVEPETAGANAQIFWVLWIKKDATSSDPAWTVPNLAAETFNQRIIACGVGSAANESPWNFSSHLNSSRNLLPGEELVFTTRILGLSTGNASVVNILCAGETGS